VVGWPWLVGGWLVVGWLAVVGWPSLVGRDWWYTNFKGVFESLDNFYILF